MNRDPANASRLASAVDFWLHTYAAAEALRAMDMDSNAAHEADIILSDVLLDEGVITPDEGCSFDRGINTILLQIDGVDTAFEISRTTGAVTVFDGY